MSRKNEGRVRADQSGEVSIDSEQELSYWRNRLCVSEGLLMIAIENAGTKVADIKRFLSLRDG